MDRGIRGRRWRVELAEQHDLQQGGHAADHVAGRAVNAGEVWRVDPGRERQRAAGAGMKWLLTMLMLVSAAAAGAERLTLAWDPSPSAAVSGYRLYYGTNTRSYQFVTNAGLVLTQSVVLAHRGRWFFAATAYSTNGLESDFSSEVSWEYRPLPPAMSGETWVRLTPVFGQSTNLATWGSVTGEATWFPATNRAEFFRVNRLLMERVMVP